ncbi:MAG: hypothetical protein Q8J78_05330 [Moraxellaceae bacterium]|nr:hypothetical protein [Moraxellaceae bacterium]
MANDDYDGFEDPVEADDDTEEESPVDAEEGPAVEAADEAGAPAPRNADLEDAETLTVSSKEALRRQLEEEMERFLARGGRIQEIPPDVTTDPPQKPVSNYGSKPI